MTGLGKATPEGNPASVPLATGQVAPADGSTIYWCVQLPVVTIGGVPAELMFWGLAPGFAGLYQVNIRVPEAAPTGDAVPLTITMPNNLSDTVSIAISTNPD